MSGGAKESRGDAPSSTDARQLGNAAGNNRGQRNPSEMFQNFEDLFHQELSEVRGASKVFAAWEEIKREVLLRVLDATAKQLTVTQQAGARQGPPTTYANMLGKGLVTSEKPVPKRLD
jgi:hypothetical protein